MISKLCKFWILRIACLFCALYSVKYACIGKIQDFALVVHKKFLDIIYAAVYNISRREETGLPIREKDPLLV